MLGRLRRICVAPALGHIGAHKGFGVILHLLHLDVVGLAALEDHMRRAGLSARCHRRNVSRLKNEESCRAGARTRRGDVHDDRNARAQNRSHHRAHGVEQAARRVHIDQECLRAVGVGAVQGPRQFVGAHWLNGVVQNKLVDHRLLLDRLLLGRLLRAPLRENAHRQHSPRRCCDQPCNRPSCFSTVSIPWLASFRPIPLPR